ncbi:MAG TPA: transporter, partial [Gammaproteobacteria bacterium]|nr:transporter [Gammaproteobacteria bacterium]
HMIIFWLAQSSNVTPPIALAAFAGAGIAGAGPMRSAVEAFKLANGLFVIPLMMAYTPLLYGVDAGWGDVLWA